MARRPRVYPPGEIVILGSICRARACSDAGADLSRGAALLPGGLAVVGAYVSGDKAAAEALVAEVKPHLDGGFALASIAADGAASFYHRFSTSDAVVALEATELEPGWLEREYALFRCAMRVPIGIDNSAGVDAALAAAEAEARSDATILVVHARGERGDDEDDEDDDTSAPPEKRKTGGGGGGGKKGKKGGKKSKGKSGGGGGGGSNAEVAAPARDRVAAGAGGRTDALLVGDLLPSPTDPTAAHRVVQVTPLVRTSSVSVESSATPLPAPAFAFRPDEDGSRARMNARSTSSDGSAFARIDALAYVPRATATFADVAAVMRSELATRCVSAAACAHLADVSFSSTTAGGSGREPACLHFSPPELGHAVTVAYPLPPGDRGASGVLEPDAGLGSVREALHWALCLPMDRPAPGRGTRWTSGRRTSRRKRRSVCGTSTRFRRGCPRRTWSGAPRTACADRTIIITTCRIGSTTAVGGARIGRCRRCVRGFDCSTTRPRPCRRTARSRSACAESGINRRVSWGANSGSGPSSSVTCWTSCSG